MSDHTPIRINNYARCHHLLCEYLIKRCKNNNLILECENDNYDTFTIQKHDKNTTEITCLKFVRNAETKTFMINDMIEIQNEHLLGLNIPNRLFELFDILQNIKANTGLNISISKNKFLIFNCPPCLDENSFFEKLSNLNIPEKFKEFRIQIADNNLFAFNRCLKMESKVLNILLEKNVNFVEMVVIYFNCFSISPTCARMQSLADDATFHVLDDYSYLHVNLYLEDYLTISKLFFPFIANVKKEYLLKNYLEIIPAGIIRKCLPAEMIEIIQSIKDAFPDDFKIEHLQNETCCLSPFLNINYKMFVRLIDVNILLMTLDILKKNFDSRIFMKETNLWLYGSDSHVEFNKAIFVDENLKIEKTVDIKTAQICRHNCKCKNRFDVISFFKLENKYVLAIAKNVNEFTVEEKTIICCFIMMLKKAFSSLIHVIPLEDKLAQVDNVKENDSVISKYLEDLENHEGILLTLFNKVLYLSNNNLLEYMYHQVKDNFYFSEEDLLTFFKEISTENMKDIIYRITKRGYICFNGFLKISPTVFLLIKNRNAFFEAISQVKKTETNIYGYNILDEIKMRKQTFTTEVYIKYCSVYTTTTDFGDKRIDRHAFDDKKWLINVVKCLFPQLQHLNNKYFQNENFCALPYFIKNIKNREKFLDFCKKLRKRKILLRIKNNDTLNLNSLLDIAILFFQYVDLSTVFEGLQSLEEISSHFRFSCRMGTAMLFFYDEKFRHFDSNIVEPLSEKSCKVLKKALVKIETNSFFSTVTVSVVNIMLNSGLIVNPLLIEHLSVDDMLKLLKLAKYQYGYTDNIFANHWISITDEKKEKTKPQNISKTFSLVDSHEHTYLSIAKLLNPILNFFSNDELMSYQCLKLFPQNLIMKNPKNLLEKLEKMHNDKCGLEVNAEGSFGISGFFFTLNQLLQCDNCHIFKSIPHFLKSLKEKTLRDYNLHQHGQFGMLMAIDEVSTITDGRKMDFEILENFLTIGAILRFNSKGFIQLGDFIWLYIDECKNIKTTFDVLMLANEYDDAMPKPFDVLMLANEYDDAMPKPEKALMKSIYNLSKLKQAKALAKELNHIMQGNLADKILENQNFLAFPVDLYNMWIRNPKNAFFSTTKALQKLKKLNLHWTFTLNGYLCINDCFMITISHLLIIQKFEKLTDLIHLLSNDIPLLCEEEIINGKNKENNISLRKIISYRDIYTIKSKTDTTLKGISVEPNGTLLLNGNIWVHPHRYLQDEENIINMSKILNEIFGGAKHRFQYGRWTDCVVTSILKSPEENFYDFCHTFCNFVQEIDDSISIKYYADKEQFCFNDCLFIHPRSFFHLQNIEAFVSALNTYKTGPEEQKNKTFLENLSNHKKSNNKDSTNLWTERVEFLPLRKFVLQEIAKLVMKFIGDQAPNLTEFFVTPEENFYLIEKLVIKGEHLFTEGMAYDFILEKNKEDLKKFPNENFKYKFRYNEDVFYMALSMCAGPDDEFKCGNLFDLQSLLESIMGYCEGKIVINNEMCKSNKPTPLPSINNMTAFEQMIAVFKTEVQRINKCQEHFEQNNKLIFSNSLKGLHHWFKHGNEKDFRKLEVYYTKMNDFIENCRKPQRSLETQDGLKIIKNYQDNEFMAGTCLEEKSQKKFVTTFRMLEKRKKEKKPFFMLFVDDAFPCDVQLSPDIKIHITVLKRLVNVIKAFPKTPSPDKIIVILNIPVGTPNRFKEIIDAIRQKFNKELHIFFHCPNAAFYENDLKIDGFDLNNVTFLKDPYIQRNNDEWKVFVETALQINQSQ